MINRNHLLAAVAGIAACALAAPAQASVFVFGNNDARLCYLAADSAMTPGPRELRRCDDALTRESLTPHDVVATHVNRGILRLRRGLVDEAVADFDRAIALDPDQAEAYLNKGAALIRRQHSAEAVGLFTIALERNTRRPALAHYGRAMANETLGNVAAAYRDYQAASRIDPRWNEPRLDLARFRVVPR